jgi:putative ABC transport system permease protein
LNTDEDMIDLDKWHEIYSVLSKNKFRTALTAFGVIWGVFMLLVMMGGGSGLQNGVTQNFDDMASNSLFVWTQRTTIPYEGFPQGRSFNFKNDDTEALLKNIPEIKYLAPRAQSGGHRGTANVIRGLKTGGFGINGDVPDFFNIKTYKILKGRLINQNDIDEKRKVAAIGRRVYESLYEPGEEPIGSNIEINGVYFTVVGLFEPKRMEGNDDEDAQSIFIPLSTFQRTFNWGDIVGWYSINIVDGVKATEIESKILKFLASRHSVSPDDKHAFGYWNTEREFTKIIGLFNGIKALIWFVGLGTLIAGVIGVSNIMLVIVKERTKEFGIKRALGATPISIISQIIVESVLITSVSGAIGLILGVVTVEGINKLMQGSEGRMFANPQVDLGIALWAITVLIISGVLAGLLPAFRAVNTRPIEALRAE